MAEQYVLVREVTRTGGDRDGSYAVRRVETLTVLIEWPEGQEPEVGIGEIAGAWRIATTAHLSRIQEIRMAESKAEA